jgi:hypothetical protein
MGFTSIAVVNMLNQYILHSVIMSDSKRPNGKICKFQRPQGSILEDIVINGLPLVKDDVDEAVLNVNIYVPNLVIPNSTDRSQPDNARLLYLSKIGNDAFQNGAEIWDEAGEYCFKYQQDTVMEDDNYQYYINFRIEFYSIN